MSYLAHIPDIHEFLKSGIDFGICYDGMIALEMPYLKIPVLLGGVNGRFGVKEGNFIIQNRADYFNNLKDFDKLIEDFNANYEKYYENIVKYTYWYIFEHSIKMPFLSKKEHKKVSLLQVKKEDLKLNEKILHVFK